MVSEPPLPAADESNLVTENSLRRPLPNKKNMGKVPKKIHKAEREKLKRDHLNELFLELGLALEPARQNNGKASILGDATRILRDLLAQVDCLRKENTALVTESHYVTVEKNELREENVVLEAEIEKLQKELEASRCNCSGPVQSQLANLASPFSEDRLPVDSTLHGAPPPGVGPLLVFPFGPEVQAYQDPNAVQAISNEPSSHVRRPQARYPTPSDTWPSQILAPRATQEAQRSSSSSRSSNSSTSTSRTSNGEAAGSTSSSE